MTSTDTDQRSDERWQVESHGIEPVPTNERHGRPRGLFKLWAGANIHYVVVVTGGLVLSFGLTPLAAITAIVIGNLLGSLVFGIASTLGPKTGTPGILSSRISFGQLGATLPKILSVVTSLSWFSINAILATDAVNALLNMFGISGPGAEWSGLIVVLVLEIVIAIYGHATIMWLESWIALFLALVFVILAALVVTHIPTGAMAELGQRDFSWPAWLGAMSLAFSFPIGWCNYAADYSRYYPENTSSTRIALAAGLGQFLPVTFCEILGVFIAVMVGGSVSSDPINQLSGILPGWFTFPLLLAVVVGGVAANVPNGYTAGLGLQALRLPISRIHALLAIGVFTIAIRIAVLLGGNFVGAYEGFLAYMSYWIAPWAAIVVVDFALRRGHYDSEQIMQFNDSSYWYTKGFLMPGIIAFVAGIAACLLFSASSTYTSPLMAHLGFGDFSFEAGLIVAGVIYFLLARNSRSYARALKETRLA